MGYHILLVDDERMELEALKSYIDWKSLGIDQVDTARNGKSAYELILEKQPDIVVTDIQMPVMDGLTLARKIYELNESVKIIFLTGYDEFSYVREAMRVHAVDFLMKPFSEESIAEAIGRVKAAIERDRLFSSSVDVWEKRMLQRLCCEVQTSSEELLQELEKGTGRQQERRAYGLIQFHNVVHRNIAGNMQKRLAEIVALWNDGDTLNFLVRGYANVRDCAERIRKILAELTGKTYSSVYLRRSVRPEELRKSYQFLKGWKDDLFYEDSGCAKAVEEGIMPRQILAEGMDSGQRKEFCRKLEECIRSGEDGDMEEALEALCLLFEEKRSAREVVLHDIYWLIFKLEEKFPDADVGEANIYDRLESTSSLSELKQLLKSHFGHLTASYGGGAGGKSAFVVRKVMEYVGKNYTRAMTVEEMAEEIHLSSNYIRSIFKEGTGQTILEYITGFRFEKACELLRDPSYKVKEVSNMVGYENVSYFCSVFTKRYGMSPNEFRNKNL